MNAQYFDQLTKNYGKTIPYQYTGLKCTKDCQRFPHYETKHSKDCPFYKGSLSEKYDKPDGVHSFEQMNTLALEWKKKHNDTLFLLQNQSMSYYDFVCAICKSIGIRYYAPSFTNMTKDQKLIKILQKITEIKTNS